MSATPEVLTLCAWWGGADAIERSIALFYRRVRDDAVLAPVFANMSPDHVARVSPFIAEVFDGPKQYSSELGGHANMIFRSALSAYLKWGTRLAVINSQPGAVASGEEPMPVWGKTKGPYVK